MNTKQTEKRVYVPPHIRVVETEDYCRLLLGSHATGGHEDALDEEFEPYSPGTGGHEDALDEDFEHYTPSFGGHHDALDEGW